MAQYFAIEVKLKSDSEQFRPIGFIEGGARAEFILKMLRLDFPFEFRGEEVSINLLTFYKAEIAKAHHFKLGNDIQAAAAKVEQVNGTLPIPHDQPAAGELTGGTKKSRQISVSTFVDQKILDNIASHAQQFGDPDTLTALRHIHSLGVNEQPAALAALRINQRQLLLDRKPSKPIDQVHQQSAQGPDAEHQKQLEALSKGAQQQRELEARIGREDRVRSLSEIAQNALKFAGLPAGLSASSAKAFPTPSADSVDTGKKDGQRLPDSVDVRDLCRMLEKQAGRGKALIQIARDFTKEPQGNSPKANSLLRQARRFRHLWDKTKP